MASGGVESKVLLGVWLVGGGMESKVLLGVWLVGGGGWRVKYC